MTGDRGDPAQVGPYRLEALLGQGGMGHVFRAVDPAGRRVALKLVKSADAAANARFQREGELAARLLHPGIVRIHAAGSDAGRLYLACELVEGARPLNAVCESEPVAAALERIIQLVDAVAAAHAVGVVHRDLKPENVLVDATGRVRVADFGLAAATDLERLTLSGAVLGTPHYMSPEQLRGDSQANREPTTDTWALGVILFEVVTGRLPFGDGGVVAHYLAAMLSGSMADFVPREPLPSQLERGLAAICRRALQVRPQDRYPSAEALGLDLLRASRGEEPEALRSRTSRSRRRRSVAVLAIGALVGALALGLGAAGSALQAERRRALGDEVSAARASQRALLARSAELRALRETFGQEWGEGGRSEALDELCALAALAEGDSSTEGAGVSALTSAVATLGRTGEALGAAAEVIQVSELDCPELRAWRVWSRLDADQLDRPAARVEARRVAQLEPTTPAGVAYWSTLRARLLARGGDFAAARALAKDLPAGVARDQIALEEAVSVLGRGEPKRAWALAANAIASGPRLAGVRERLRLLAEARVEPAFVALTRAPGSKDLRENLDACLRVLGALGGGTPPPLSVWSSASEQKGLMGAGTGDLPIVFAEAYPDSYLVQYRISMGLTLRNAWYRDNFSQADKERLVRVGWRCCELTPPPERVRALISFATGCQAIGEFSSMLEALTSVSRASIPAEARGDFETLLAAAYIRHGQFEIALELYQGVLARRDSVWAAEAAFQVFRCYTHLRRRPEAKAAALRYLEMDPTQGGGVLTDRDLALTYLYDEVLAGADPEVFVEALERLLARPNSQFATPPSWRVRLALVYLERGAVEKAREALQGAAERVARGPAEYGYSEHLSAGGVTALARRLGHDRARDLRDLRALVSAISEVNFGGPPPFLEASGD